jgi:hypothetical protein
VGYCWCRTNTILSVVERSNAAFESIAIASMAFVFVFLYALEADPMYVGGPPTLLLQSASLFVAGFLGYLALRYAIHAGLTAPELKADVEKMTRLDLSNPLTALASTALSWSGVLIWTVSWFVFMPLFSFLLGRSAKQPGHST